MSEPEFPLIGLGNKNSWFIDRLAGVNLPVEQGFLAVREWIENAVLAAQSPFEDGLRPRRVWIQVNRRPQEDPNSPGDIITPVGSVIISDTGPGLTEERRSYLQEIDGPGRDDDRGRGIGRLLAAKVFEAVELESYEETPGSSGHHSSSLWKATFSSQGVGMEKLNKEGEIGTAAYLKGMRKEYSEHFPHDPLVLRSMISDSLARVKARDRDRIEVFLLDEGWYQLIARS